jgi:hypothetical protein
MPYGKMYEEKYAKELAVIRNAEKMGDMEAASRVARRDEQIAAEREKDLRKIAAESARDLEHANSDQKGMEMQKMSKTHEMGGSRRTRRRRKRKPSRRRTTTRKRTKRTKRSRAKRSTKRRRPRGRK